MSKRGEEALVTWKRIMEHPRAHGCTEIESAATRAACLSFSDMFEQLPSDWLGSVLGRAERAHRIPSGSEVVFGLAHSPELRKLLGLDPWLLTPSTPEAEAAAFNERYPVGTRVGCSFADRHTSKFRTVTLGRAFADELTGVAMVAIEGRAQDFCHPLSHVEPVQ